jgi:hypothetical protein
MDRNIGSAEKKCEIIDGFFCIKKETRKQKSGG